MLIEAARRAEAAVKEMLALVNNGSASCAEAREALAISKAISTVNSAFQTGAAAVIAKVERHGDGGTQVLADAAGLTRHDAQGQVKTAQAIEAVPVVRDAVEEGRVSIANAKRLAEAIEKTSAGAVESDTELLSKAESMRPEQFTKAVRRWAADRQDDGGEADYRRLRAKRYVRIWDSDDGTVELHGKFDPVAGRRIGNRLQAEARRTYDNDKKQAADSGAEPRSFNQCMADALDNLTTNNTSGGGKPFADICVVAHVDDATAKLVAELPNGVRLPTAVLDQLTSNAKLTGVIYDRRGKPIWRTEARRTATEAQRQLLIARYGGCFHCGANPAMCQPHHIEPVSQGGPTKLENMVPACWDCHDRIHYDGWQIRKSPDGQHTLHPPGRVTYGPAHAPAQPLLHVPDNALMHDLPSERETDTRQSQPVQPRQPRAECEPDLAVPPDHSARSGPGSADIARPLPRPGPATARAALRRAGVPRDGPHTTKAEHSGGAPISRAPSGPPGQQHGLLFSPD